MQTNTFKNNFASTLVIRFRTLINRIGDKINNICIFPQNSSLISMLLFPSFNSAGIKFNMNINEALGNALRIPIRPYFDKYSRSKTNRRLTNTIRD